MPAMVVLALAIFLACGGQSVETTSGELTIYYIPFDVETFSPVTVDRIEGQASCVFHLSADERAAERLRMLLYSGADGEFDSRRVRLKAVGLARAPVFADADGGVRDEKGDESRLEAHDFKSLTELMANLAEEQGCDLYGEKDAR